MLPLTRTLALACAVLAVASAAFGPYSGWRGKSRGRNRFQKKLQNYLDIYKEPTGSEPDCTTIFIGHMTLHETELDLIRLRMPRSLVDLPNMDEDVAGQEVIVCNRDQNGAPLVIAPPEGFSPIAVISSNEDDWSGAANFVMRVIQYMHPPVYDNYKK